MVKRLFFTLCNADPFFPVYRRRLYTINSNPKSLKFFSVLYKENPTLRHLSRKPL